MNWSLLHPRNNPQFHYLFYNSTLIIGGFAFVSPYFSHETPLDNQLTMGNAITYMRWLGATFHQVSIIVTLKHLTLDKFHFAFFAGNSFTTKIFPKQRV
jgi:hypothetical protein